MRIYLDTKDLINLFEKSIPCSPNEFQDIMAKGKHRLVLSLPLVIEISTPLVKSSKSNVMRVLNRIEKMDIEFIRVARLPLLELLAAFAGMQTNEENQSIDPFANRLVDTFLDAPRYANRIGLGLAQTIFTIWQNDPSLLEGYGTYSELLRITCEKDRAMANQPDLRRHFLEVVRRMLKQEKILWPLQQIQALSEWIYQKPSRAPSIRLGYEVFHSFIRNRTHIPGRGEIPDLTHIDCTPYVDIITLDRSWRRYVKEVCQKMGVDYLSRVCKDLDEVIQKISNSG